MTDGNHVNSDGDTGAVHTLVPGTYFRLKFKVKVVANQTRLASSSYVLTGQQWSTHNQLKTEVTPATKQTRLQLHNAGPVAL